jgi:MFS family permease
VFEDRLGGLLGDGTIGPGVAVMIVYGFSALMQVTAGHLADRFSLKWVYLFAWVVQAPLLAVAAVASGAPLLVTAMLMVTCNTGSLPAENMLLARYTPERWRATAFGIKFVLNFGMAALAVPVVGLVRSTSGDFLLLFAGLAALALAVGAYALRLPIQPVENAQPQAAE